MTNTTIRLPKGWTLELDDSTREEGYQGFVTAPGGRDSASLVAARAMGMTTGDEIEIPAEVMAEIEKDKYDQYE